MLGKPGLCPFGAMPEAGRVVSISALEWWLCAAEVPLRFIICVNIGIINSSRSKTFSVQRAYIVIKTVACACRLRVIGGT